MDEYGRKGGLDGVSAKRVLRPRRDGLFNGFALQGIFDLDRLRHIPGGILPLAGDVKLAFRCFPAAVFVLKNGAQPDRKRNNCFSWKK